MAELPSGTVTFLFSDVEGSTRLLARLRDRYVAVLAEHQRLLRAAFDEHDGCEVHTEGDAFFVAFARASDAIAAAVSAQRALASSRWPEGVEVRVRMGLHTGEAQARDDDYVGMDVHRAARICSCGHGGQVLVSGATCQLVAGELPPDVALRDLGEHWLKDLDRPERLFQLVVADLPPNFPPPAARSSRADGANGLPPLPNRTIGRADDVRAIVDRVRVESVRLLTLTGPGGVGKTRLALEAARAARTDFGDGARFVSLAALQTPDQVPAEIVQTLGIVVLSGESAEHAAERYLAAKHLLLVLDNCEHILAAAPLVGRLIAACPAVTVLATSREPLALQTESRYPVSPLAVPDHTMLDDPSALAHVDAVALFCERAQAQDPGFDLLESDTAVVAEICRRVDGLPLAIELAAARCALLSVGEINARLDATVGALGRGPRDAPGRQQTLWATVNWSHDLLTEDEQRCFARFAVFAGGATVEAAQTVTRADLDTLESLVAKSLLVRIRNVRSGTRLAMLETIRAFAREHLNRMTDLHAVCDGHYRHYLAMAERHGSGRALWGADRKSHASLLDEDAANLDEALRWASSRADAEPALRMCAALGDHWLMHHRYADAVRSSDHALALPAADAHPALQVRVLGIKASALQPLAREMQRPPIDAEAERIARSTADRSILWQALQARAVHEVSAGRLDLARPLADEALRSARAAQDEWGVAMASYPRAVASESIVELRERVEDAVALLDAVGNVYLLADLLSSATYMALAMDSLPDAQAFSERAIPATKQVGNPFQWMNLCGNLGLVTLLSGHTARAEEAFREQLRLCRELAVPVVALEPLHGLAAIAATNGDDGRAARLVGAAEAHRYGWPRDPVQTQITSTFLEPARARHGPDTWDAAVADGAALSLAQAIADALEETPV